MSCYEWEAGELLLPAAAVKPLRDKLNKAHNERRATVMAAAKTVSITLRGTRGTGLDDRYFVIGRAVTSANPRGDEGLQQDIVDVLYRTYTPAATKRGSGRFRAVTGADLDAVVGPLATNRTTSWRVGNDATITLNDRRVHWDVSENNHAVDHAHAHPLAGVFFNALDNITWTRGTGGEIVGNNEYSRESRDAGGGGNYVTRSYSPESAKERQLNARLQTMRGWKW